MKYRALLDNFTIDKPSTVRAGDGRYPVELPAGTWCAMADGIFIERGVVSGRRLIDHLSRRKYFPRFNVPCPLEGE